jgi:hypothetical protein
VGEWTQEPLSDWAGEKTVDARTMNEGRARAMVLRASTTWIERPSDPPSIHGFDAREGSRNVTILSIDLSNEDFDTEAFVRHFRGYFISP